MTLRGLAQGTRVILTFPFAFFLPFIIVIALSHTMSAATGWATILLSTAAISTALALRPSVRFTKDHLVVGLTFRRRRIPWADIRSITYSEFTDSESGEVSHRLISVRYRRDPDQPLPPTPDTFGDIWRWQRAHFRTGYLPLAFPASGESWNRRPLARKREIILRELAVRGYQLPD